MQTFDFLKHFGTRMFTVLKNAMLICANRERRYNLSKCKLCYYLWANNTRRQRFATQKPAITHPQPHSEEWRGMVENADASIAPFLQFPVMLIFHTCAKNPPWPQCQRFPIRDLIYRCHLEYLACVGVGLKKSSKRGLNPKP